VEEAAKGMNSPDGWNFNGSAENESVLRPLCKAVEQHLNVPTARLHRYFAVNDDSYLQQANGQHYRGFYCHIAERNGLPSYLFDCFFHTLDQFTVSSFKSFDDMVAFEHLIYIRASTCSDPTGCVATYAHELQHLIQHQSSPRLLRVNNALYQTLKKYEPTATASDIPYEREANIVSKRVAEAVCGVEAVSAFAAKQVRFMEELGNTEQRDRWVFFRDVPSSTPYDLLEATLPFVERYKTMIDFGVSVEQPEWWVGPLEE
jgi:hypothetical protein